PQAGTVALTDHPSPADIAAFTAAHAHAVHWCNEHPDEAGALAHEVLPMLDALAVADAMRAAPLNRVDASAAGEALRFFYQTLLEYEPAAVGGQQPNDAFYAAGQAAG